MLSHPRGFHTDTVRLESRRIELLWRRLRQKMADHAFGAAPFEEGLAYMLVWPS